MKYDDLKEVIYKSVNIASGRKENWHWNKDKLKDNNNNKKYKRNPVKWWDAECKMAIQKRKDKLKIYHSEGSMTSYIEYKRSSAIARKIIKTKKREYFKNFCNSIIRWTSLSYVWKTIKIKQYK